MGTKQPKLDYKCERCGKAESKHRAFGKECPTGISQFSKIETYKASEEPTNQSKREVLRYNQGLKG